MKQYDIKASIDGLLSINDTPILHIPSKLRIPSTNYTTEAAYTKLIIATVTHYHNEQLKLFNRISDRLDKLEKQFSDFKNDIQIEIDYHPDIGKETHAAKQRFNQQK